MRTPILSLAMIVSRCSLSAMDEVSVEVFNKYVLENQVNSDPQWEIKPSPLGGRGVFAKRLIQTGELLFVDPPLVLGPRSSIECAPVCVGCHRTLSKPQSCTRGCGLPVCNWKCEKSDLHRRECKLLQNGQTVPWSRALLTATTSIRCLFLNENDRKVLENLEGHKSVKHDLVIDLIREKITPDEAKIIRLGCEVLDAVAFETPCVQEGSSSLQGIYPLSALMNHDCVPNTRHCFDDKNRMVVESTMEIAEGQEVTTTYTCLTWGNQARRHHLARTKRFHCACARCRDPQEFGSRLQALYCMRPSCNGVLLPSGDIDGKWKCTDCTSGVSQVKMGVIQSAIGSLIASMDATDPKKMSRLLREKSVVPNSNQVAVELKFSLSRLYGNEKGFCWDDLSDQEITLKELVCGELLLLLKILKLGECRLKGFLLVEMYLTMKAKCRRNGNFQKMSAMEVLFRAHEESDLSKQAKAILKYDYSAQKLLKTLG